jgi:hypothetical protein
MALITYVFKIYQNMTPNSTYCSYYYNYSKRHIYYVFVVLDVNTTYEVIQMKVLRFAV